MRPIKYCTYRGEKRSLRELSGLFGIKFNTLWDRLYRKNLSLEDALELPSREYKCKNRGKDRERRQRIDRAVEAWDELMIARYGQNYRSRFRMQSYRECSRHYRELINNQLMVA